MLYFQAFLLGLGEIISYFDAHSSILTIFGWLAVALLGIWGAKVQLRNSARLEIYKQLYELKLKMDDAASHLGVSLMSFSLPFRDMEWADKGYKNLDQDKTASQIWLDYANKVQSQKGDFVTAYLDFWTALNIWRAELAALSEARDILFNELGDVTDKIQDYAQSLPDLILNINSAWQTWDREGMKKKADEMEEEFNQIAITYVRDFMDMIHEELVQPIFSRKRKPREDYNYFDAVTSPTLTRKGIKNIKYPPTRVALLRMASMKRRAAKI